MGVADYVRKAAESVPRRQKAGHATVSGVFGRAAEFGRYALDSSLHQDQYTHNAGYVYSIVRTIANRICGQPIRHARKVSRGDDAKAAKGLVPTKDAVPHFLKGNEKNLRVFEDSPIIRAFMDPNPVMVRYTVMFNTVASLELTGKAFWWMRWGKNNRPEIWPLPSHWMEPIHSPHLFAGWYVSPGGGAERFTLAANEVCYFYYPSPADPLESYAPLTALAKTVMADESVEEAQRRSFLNSFNPGLAITLGSAAADSPTGAESQPVLTRAQRRALKTILRDEYRGTVNFGEPLILDGFIKDAKPIFASPKELDFLNSGTATKSRLAQGWGMNPISMGEVEGANRSSSATADDHMVNNVVNPRIAMMSEVMTCWMPRFFTRRRDEVVYLEPASSKDIDYELQRDEKLFTNGGLSVNGWRENHGLPRIRDGDRALVNGEWVDVLPEEAGAAKKGKGPRGVKVTDASGHEHADDGKFGSGGGSSGSSESADPDGGNGDESEGADHSKQHEKWEKEDDKLQEKHDAELEKHDEKHEKATEKVEAGREKEDDKLSDFREKEDDKVEKSREKEDDKLDKQDEKDEEASDKTHEKEEANIEKSREKGGKELEKRQGAEKKEAEKAHKDATAKIGKDRDAAEKEMDDRHEKEAEEASGQPHEQDVLDRHAKELKDHNDKFDALEATEDAKLESLDKKHEAERDAHETHHDELIKHNDAAKDTRDGERVGRREAVEKDRADEDADRKSQREAEDKETGDKRKTEDAAREQEYADGKAVIEAKHDDEKKKVAGDRKKQNPDAHAAYAGEKAARQPWRKVRDDVGHEHGADGRFGSGGSGGSHSDDEPAGGSGGGDAGGSKPTSFGSVEDSDKWGNEKFADWAGSLSDDESNSVAEYVGEAFRDINNSLRGGKWVTDGDLDPAELKEHVKNLDAALKKSSLPDDVTVFRGVSGDVARQFIKLAETGGTFTDKGFMSTSLAKDISESFSQGNGGALVHMNLPKGSKGAYVDAAGCAGGEGEVLLPRGSSFKVTSAKKVGDKWHIQAELVAAAKSAKSGGVVMGKAAGNSSSGKFAWGDDTPLLISHGEKGQKVRDDSGHEHGSDGRFGSGGGGGSGGGSDKPAAGGGKPKPGGGDNPAAGKPHDPSVKPSADVPEIGHAGTGKVGDSDGEFAEKAKGFLGQVAQFGKKALGAAVACKEKCRELAYRATAFMVENNITVDDILETPEDMAKICNDPKMNQAISDALGIPMNTMVQNAICKVGAFAITKIKQLCSKQKRDGGDTPKDGGGKRFRLKKGEKFDKDAFNAELLGEILKNMGVPPESVPDADEFREMKERAKAAHARRKRDTVGGKFFKLPSGSKAAGLGVKAVAGEWHRRHDHYRGTLAAVFSDALSGLGAKAAAEVRRYRGREAASAVETAVDVGKWADTLRRAASEVVTEAAVSGAMGEWELSGPGGPKSAKAFGVPNGVLRRAAEYAAKLLAGPGIARLVKSVVALAKAAALAAGVGGDAGAAAAAKLSDPDAFAPVVAKAAAVESAAAINGGRHAAYETLKAAGKVRGRQWVAVRDGKARDAHAHAHGQTAYGDEPFTVGGEKCMFPGDPELSIGQRINCRCVTISVG